MMVRITSQTEFRQQMRSQGWQGGLIRLKKAGLNRMDKKSIRFKARWAPERSLKIS